jgi:hypothetical protein
MRAATSGRLTLDALTDANQMDSARLAAQWTLASRQIPTFGGLAPTWVAQTRR